MDNIVIIRSGVNPNLVLSTTPNFSRVFVKWYNPSDPQQQWIREDHGPNFRLINVAWQAGMFSVHASDGNIGVGGTGDLWNAPGAAQFETLRLAEDPQVNLNVNLPADKADVDTLVLMYGPQGGAANELWQLINLNDAPATKTVLAWFFPGDGGGVNIMEANKQGGYRIVPTPSVRDWSLLDPTQLFDVTLWDAGGYSFRNRGTNKFVSFNGAHQPVNEADQMSLRSLWAIPGPGQSPGFYFGMKPWLNQGQALNMGAVQPKNTVAVWDWWGGRSEEVFGFTYREPDRNWVNFTGSLPMAGAIGAGSGES